MICFMELAVEVEEPKSEPKLHKSAEAKKSAVEEKPAVQPKQSLQPGQHRSKRGHRVSIAVAAASILILAFLVWKYLWPLLR